MSISKTGADSRITETGKQGDSEKRQFFGVIVTVSSTSKGIHYQAFRLSITGKGRVTLGRSYRRFRSTVKDSNTIGLYYEIDFGSLLVSGWATRLKNGGFLSTTGKDFRKSISERTNAVKVSGTRGSNHSREGL